ncbi:MAG: hypothetical protein DI582_04550 [Azospirillum brasilense]|nr:MAG: hypothetical protein DI582_04550 [Azospirillum brasilense]
MTNDMSTFLQQVVPPVEPAATPVQPQPANPAIAASPAPARPAPVAMSAEPLKRRAASSNTQMPDLGILKPLMEDDRVHDILINGTENIFVDMDGQLYDTGLAYQSEEEVWALAELIMDTIGQRWDDSRPLIDTRLPDGSRVNIVAPPMAVDGVSISIRKFPSLTITLDSMAANGQLTKEISEFLKLCAARKLNIIISGGTSSGKTTLLNALSASISPRERIVTIEDSAELRLQQPHVVRLESKAPTSMDAPHTAVTIRDLVKNALRMRPDRIVVGESRGAEAFDVLQAMNTGHDGSMTTLHSNNPREALGRLETMISVAMPQLTTRIVRQQIASTIHIIIQMARTKDGARRVTHVSEVAGMEGEMIVMQDLVLFQEAPNKPAEYRWVAGAPRNPLVADAARAAGFLRSLR